MLSTTPTYTHDDIKLGVDVDNSVFRVDNWQRRDSPSNEQVNSVDERRFWCCLSMCHTHTHMQPV